MDIESKREIIRIYEEDIKRERREHPEIKRNYLNPELYEWLNSGLDFYEYHRQAKEKEQNMEDL